MKTLITLVISFLVLTSCIEEESGNIQIQNKVHNAKLDNISFGTVSVYSSLIPGETSSEVTITDEEGTFPKINQIEFFMQSNGNRVYLKTKKKYQLNAGETLLIVISDTTEVISPLFE